MYFGHHMTTSGASASPGIMALPDNFGSRLVAARAHLGWSQDARTAVGVADDNLRSFCECDLNPPALNAAARRRQKLSVPRLPGYSQLRRFRVREPVKTTAPFRIECSDRAETVLDINAHRLYPLRAMASGRWSACLQIKK